MWILRLSFLLTVAFGLLSCTAEQRPLEDGGSVVLSGPYRLDTGDAVRVTVFEQPTLSNSYSVDQSGFIAMPLIGQVPARGRSAVELQSMIRTRLAERYLRDPDISVEVSEYRPFFIYGAVNSGGRYAYSPGMTAETAIATAGGFSGRASTRNVRVSRTVSGRKQEAIIAVSDPVRPGDTIFVPGQSYH